MNEQQVAEIRKEAVAALRAILVDHTAMPAERSRAAELLLHYADDFDPSPARIGHFHSTGSAGVVERARNERQKPAT